MKIDKLTVGSLFSGIGGIDLGLERAGMEIRWQVEIDDYARRVLEKHWPDVKRYKDVKEITEKNKPEEVDLIAGGFPCQDISIAGKGKGIIEGERSSLWFEMLRIIRMVRPRFVLIENVSALTFRGLDTVLLGLAQSGYDAEWNLISAESIGARHFRKRIFIVAYMGNTFGEGLEGYGKFDRVKREIYTPEADIQLREAFERNRRGIWREDPAERDVPESRVGRMAYGVPHRVDRIRGLGNSVVPQVAEFIGKLIIDRTKGE